MSQRQDELYQEASVAYGDALDRLVRAYEFDVDKRGDLLQDIHLALWRSFEKFEARCSIRTWVYRVAHNIGTSYMIRQRRANRGSFLSLDDLDAISPPPDNLSAIHDRMDIERLLQLIHRLNPPDREVMLLYLEDLDAATIGEIMETSAVSVRSKIHRIKTLLARRFHQGGRDATSTC